MVWKDYIQLVWKDYIQFLQWILYKIIELQVGKGVLLIFEMCAVIAWNINSGPLTVLEITDIQQDAVLFSQGGGGGGEHTSIHLTGMFI